MSMVDKNRHARNKVPKGEPPVSKPRLPYVDGATKGRPPYHEANGEEPRTLSAGDLADLRASGLTDETIHAEGLYTERDPFVMAGIVNCQPPPGSGRQVPRFCEQGCLVIPYRALDGASVDFARVKPRTPRHDKKGKPIKYEQPWGAPNRLYIPAATVPRLAGPAGDLDLAEGEKKALALSQLGLAAVAVGGVQSWRKEKGSTELLDDLAVLARQGWGLIVHFDYDPKQKTRENNAAALRLRHRPLPGRHLHPEPLSSPDGDAPGVPGRHCRRRLPGTDGGARGARAGAQAALPGQGIRRGRRAQPCPGVGAAGLLQLGGRGVVPCALLPLA
jgi:hypothetical protein